MENQSLHSFINLVVNENLAQAKDLISDQLNKKLASALEAKFEEFAPSIFEKWDAEKADKNKYGICLVKIITVSDKPPLFNWFDHCHSESLAVIS